MSDLRVTNLKGRNPGEAPTLPDGVVITGITTVSSVIVGTGINVSGVITATSFFGSGSGLTGVGLGTTGSINTSGIITASSFSGNGSGLTGIGGTSVFAAGTAAAPSISPTGDSNTGIFFPSADTIAFAEGGAEAMRVDSSGRLLIGTSTATANGGVLELSGGITFPATAVAASDVNTLDDYEEGTFTPALGDSAGSVSTMSTQEGKYVKVGKIVQFSLQIVWTAKNTWTGTNTRINGLPFAATANTGAYGWPISTTMNCNLTTTAFNYTIEATTTRGYIMDLLGNQMDASNFPSSGRVLVNGVYQTA